tara:strand:+ start:405 stop:3920 length:3516 start_codon:yes stop_codon:yes gene_type:complete
MKLSIISCIDDGSCYFNPGCTNNAFLEFYTQGYVADYDNGSCSVGVAFGCTNVDVLEFNPFANFQRDGDCGANTPIIRGCTDRNALNFNNLANSDNGTCSYIDQQFAEGIAREKERIATTLSSMLVEHAEEIKTLTQSTNLSSLQKTVRGGTIQRGRESTDKLLLYQSDYKSNLDESRDVVQQIYDRMYPNAANPNSTEPAVGLVDMRFEFFDKSEQEGGGTSIRIIFGLSQETLEIDVQAISSHLNQFVDIQETFRPIDPDKAKTVLDDTIFELLPPTTSRQERINNFFAEYQQLRPPVVPIDTGAVIDADEDGVTDTIDPNESSNYSSLYDISNTTNQAAEENKYITWQQSSEDGDNADKSLEWLSNDIVSNFFPQSQPSISVEDNRPEYESTSQGYLQIRNLNQGIVVRSQTGNDVGLIGNDPNDPVWRREGFTISMWVKFLDKVSSGTLFNFGNPIRTDSPYGFRLETYTLGRDELASSGNGKTFGQESFDRGMNLFPGEETRARFVRLLVRDDNNLLRDSQHGYNSGENNNSGLNFKKSNPTEFAAALYDFEKNQPVRDYTEQGLDNAFAPAEYGWDSEKWLLPYTTVPIKLDEWFLVVANYDPTRDEVHTVPVVDPDYWKWKCSDVIETGDNTNTYVCDPTSYISNSGKGSKLKVEVIGRSELLRGLGYKTEEPENLDEATTIDENTSPPPLVLGGCRAPTATNYNEDATFENGTCIFPDPNATATISLDGLLATFKPESISTFNAFGSPGVYYGTNNITAAVDYFDTSTTIGILTIDISAGNAPTVGFQIPLPTAFRGKEVFLRQAILTGQPTLLRIENVGGGDDAIEIDGTQLDFSDSYAVNLPVTTGQLLFIRPIPFGLNNVSFGQTRNEQYEEEATGINLEGERGMATSEVLDGIIVEIPTTDLNNNPIGNNTDWGKATFNFNEFEITTTSADPLENNTGNTSTPTITINFNVISPPNMEGFGELAQATAGEVPTLIGLGEADIQLQVGETSITIEETLLPKTFEVQSLQPHYVNAAGLSYLSIDSNNSGDESRISTVTIGETAPTDSVIQITIDLTPITIDRDDTDPPTDPIVTDPIVIRGCTDPAATNYNSIAEQDNGTCIYPDPVPEDILGCTDLLAINYNSLATIDDGTCQYDTRAPEDIPDDIDTRIPRDKRPRYG